MWVNLAYHWGTLGETLSRAHLALGKGNWLGQPLLIRSCYTSEKRPMMW